MYNLITSLSTQQFWNNFLWQFSGIDVAHKVIILEKYLPMGIVKLISLVLSSSRSFSWSPGNIWVVEYISKSMYRISSQGNDFLIFFYLYFLKTTDIKLASGWFLFFILSDAPFIIGFQRVAISWGECAEILRREWAGEKKWEHTKCWGWLSPKREGGSDRQRGGMVRKKLIFHICILPYSLIFFITGIYWFVIWPTKTMLIKI